MRTGGDNDDDADNDDDDTDNNHHADDGHVIASSILDDTVACAGFRITWSRFEPWRGLLCYVLGQTTLQLLCLFSPNYCKCIK